jgi:hypothetical protein
VWHAVNPLEESPGLPVGVETAHSCCLGETTHLVALGSGGPVLKPSF